jgi:anti-anti-sigma factor
MLRINIQTRGATATLHCSGRIVFGLEAETLRSITKSRPERLLQLDLENVETIDAYGLGLLVELQHWAIREYRSLTVTNVSTFIMRLLVMTRLNRVLAIAPAEAPQCSPYDQRAGSTALGA